MLADTKIVVGERPQDVTILDLVIMVPRRHAIQFLLQQPQLGYLIADRVELPNGDRIGINAWSVGVRAQFQQFPNSLDRESEIASMLDKGQSFPIV